MLFPTGFPGAGECFQQCNNTACVGTSPIFPGLSSTMISWGTTGFSNNKTRKTFILGTWGLTRGRLLPPYKGSTVQLGENSFISLSLIFLPALPEAFLALHSLALHSKWCYTGHQYKNPRGFIPLSENKMIFRFFPIQAWNEANFAFSLKLKHKEKPGGQGKGNQVSRVGFFLNSCDPKPHKPNTELRAEPRHGFNHMQLAQLKEFF